MSKDTESMKIHPTFYVSTSHINTKAPVTDTVSAFSCCTEREAVYARLDEEISTLEKASRSLKRRRNELSLIHRLPSELLSTIFTFTRDSDPTLAWTHSVSHVCSHWRHIALNCPNLWTEIPFWSLSWAEEMLARSGSAPLSVDAIVAECTTELIAILRSAVAQPTRIKDLALAEHLWPGTPKFHDFIFSLGNLSQLETCDIRFSTNRDKNRLSDDMFEDASLLTQLTLSYCRFNWLSLTSSTNLRKLSVSLISTLHPLKSEVVAVLISMPRLESIYFEFSFASPIGSGDDDASYTTIYLPCLQELVLDCPLNDCAFLLDRTIYPTDTKINIHTELRCDESGATTAYLPPLCRLSDCLLRRYYGPIMSLAIKDQEFLFSMTLPRCVRPHHSPTSDEARGPPEVLLALRFTEDAWDVPAQQLELTKSILQVWSLQDLQSLEVQGTALQSSDFVTIFGDLPCMETIIVYGGGANTDLFLDALCSGMHLPLPQHNSLGLSAPIGHEGPCEYKFRALRYLTVASWTMGRNYGTEGQTKCIDRLLPILAARRAMGIILELLRMRDCMSVEREDVIALKKEVVQIEWVTTIYCTGQIDPTLDL